ncbi:TadE/TadG family type IV pilus assembly protein [Beijerinckia sp. L45]|uniref:TadE/TadG family type IV pilus assembly protein n=1 Tax=Beijerinckia sp. L45 TaxID=1641855 RepID=UPI00131E66BC|nr:TadE/TadG family type IV pilus assembly protein [Beijerinckia sp. L45]
MIASMARKLRHLLSDRSGASAVIFAIAAVPTFCILGFAIDYSLGISDKTKLDGAADAASMVAITTASNIINAQNGSLTSPIDAFAAGNAQALVAFKANAGRIAFAGVPTPSSTMTNSGQTISATVSYTTPMASQFSSMIGVKTLNIGGTSTSTMTIGSYLDFYLMVDMSGSMGLPTAASDQTKLALVNTDNKSAYPSGCVFACHMADKLCTDPKTSQAAQCQGFNLSRSNGIVLRVDSVTSAVCQFLQSASNQETLANQFRVGIYPFITTAGQFFPVNSPSPTSSDLQGAMTAVGCTTALYSGPQATMTVPALTNLLDTGTSTTYGSGGTHFEAALPFVQKKISPIGKGANSAQAAPYLFLISDGMQNNQYYNSFNTWPNGSTPQALDPSNCANIKSLGVTISVLYIPYTPINPANASFANNEDGKANAAIPADAAALQACASDGFFHTANTSADITTTLQQMLSQALQAAHIAK